MIRPRLLTPREAAQILGLSFPSVKNWIYKGKLQTVKTPGGPHRIPEAEIDKYLERTLPRGNPNKWKVGSDKIGESNQLVGRILQIKVDRLVAQVTLAVGDYRLTSLITADAASDLRLKIGDSVVALLKSSQVMILRSQM